MKLDQYRGSTDIGRRPKIFSRHGDLSSCILCCSRNIFRLKNSGLPQQKGGTTRQVRSDYNNTGRKTEWSEKL